MHWKSTWLLLCLWIVTVEAGVVRAQAPPRPNVVFILIDDLGYADIEPFGSKLNRTPELQRMADEGMRLTNYYAAPVCSPSRAALMTGCYPKRSLPIPHVLFPGNDVGLSPDEVTVAEVLQQQGYATACIGKWHLGDQPDFLPTRQGFDYFFGLPYSNDMGPAADGVKSNLGAPIPESRGRGAGQPPLPLMRNEKVLQRVLAHDQTTLVQRYTDEAVQFIRQHRGEPFFLYLPHTAVHFPIYPGEAFQGQSANGIYGDWVEELDASVGRVLGTLRELELAEKTLVIFTSDNGGTARGVNAPLRGFKGSVWEGGLRVPTIAWWPGRVPAGTSRDAITGMMDILPTLAALAGGRPQQDRHLDGADIGPLLTGAAETTTRNDFFYFRGLKLEAVRQGPWKLHLARRELYHLEQDVAESVDVASEHPQVVQQLLLLSETMRDDLGLEELGPGCRALGRVSAAVPLINHDGSIRPGFK
jgi:arylsulfatase A